MSTEEAGSDILTTYNFNGSETICMSDDESEENKPEIKNIS